MYIVFIILGILLGLIVLLLIIAIFSKKSYFVERSVLINKPKQTVFQYVRLLKNQDNYSKWVMMDPNMKKSFRGEDGTVGFVYAWDSPQKDAGKGEHEIKKVEEDYMETEIRFERPFRAVSRSEIILESSDGQTKMRWTFASAMPYPMNVIMVFVNFENLLGKDMETSLVRLKGILES